MSGDSVPAFCADLGELRRRSSRSAAALAAQLSVSRGHFYSILKGEIRRPPDFSGFVEPFVRACGGTDEEVAQWRKRHAELERSYEEQRRQQRAAVGSEGQNKGRGTASEGSGGESGGSPGGDAGAGAPQYEYVRPRNLWALLAGAGVMVMVLSVITAVVTTQLSDDEDEPKVASPAPSTSTTAAVTGAELCPLPAPAEGKNVLDALPDVQQTGNPLHRLWWSSNEAWLQFGHLAEHGFDAQVQGGRREPWELIVVRSCVPLTGGAKYRLTFQAQADHPAHMRVRVQENPPTNLESFERDLEIGAGGKTYSYTFTAARTYPAGELTFQVGDNTEDFELTISDVAIAQIPG
ncbi:hypothetical protein LWF15_01075 [Kineosporia rhizophila]|uniref:helix-turn-helix domain-containing protein n=1 Tax=Kineosporia rhizophila TaxID=84633 RepID=UPI001E50EFB9|nr:helix-turn-helix domain-containing protein [Kineosporia rhizophila]MCE0534097.1 hypothetical protein [Kineosporia rhizophila]